MASLTDNALLRSMSRAIGAGPGQNGLIDLITPQIDPNNTINYTLAVNETWVGQWTDISERAGITISVASFAASVGLNLIRVDFSNYPDGPSHRTLLFSLSEASFGRWRSLSYPRLFPYYRIRAIGSNTVPIPFSLVTVLDVVPPPGTVNVSVEIDSPEPTPTLELADGLPNFVVPVSGSALLSWNGAAWDRSQVDVLLNQISGKLNSLDNWLNPSESKSASVTNGVASVTFSGDANTAILVTNLAVSLSADPASPVTLTITSTGADTFTLDLTKSGFAPFPVNWLGAVGESVTVSLAAAGPGVVGKVNASIRRV